MQKNIAYTLLNNESDIIETIISYPAPIADGPLIQEASCHYLLKGVTHDVS
jgi:tryptophan synthase alpha subunit